MSAVIEAIHQQPGHRWTIEALGVRVGMSRSIFAQRFKAKVGSSPMEYLTRWRMLLAGDRLSSTEDTLSDIARSLRYDPKAHLVSLFDV